MDVHEFVQYLDFEQSKKIEATLEDVRSRMLREYGDWHDAHPALLDIVCEECDSRVYLQYGDDGQDTYESTLKDGIEMGIKLVIIHLQDKRERVFWANGPTDDESIYYFVGEEKDIIARLNERTISHIHEHRNRSKAINDQE